MATTRLMPLHIGKGKSVQSALGRTIDYVENSTKTDDGELISSYQCDPLIAEQEFLFSKSQYASVTGRNQGSKDVIAYHLRQSFKPEEIANKIGYDLAMSPTQGKPAFIICTHVDKRHIHSHIVFNSTNLKCDKKFRNFWGSSFAVRKISDRLCLENGLSIIENPKPAKGSYATWLGEKPPTFSDKLRLAIDEVLATKLKSFDEFLQLMQAKGFEFKDGKHIAFKGAGQNKFIRLRSLGESYSEDYIKDVIDGKVTHNPIPKERSTSQKKVNLLVDIQTKLNDGKGKWYEQWATIFNLKQMAKTFNYLQENNLLSCDALDKKAESISAEFDDLLAQIKAAENRLAEIKALKKHIINYMKTKDAYAEYRQSGYSKKVQAKYETELILHKASKAYFDKLGLKKLPTIKSLQAEEQELYQSKNQAYGKYKKAKTEMQDILNAKMNVDRILNLKQAEKTQERTQEAR